MPYPPAAERRNPPLAVGPPHPDLHLYVLFTEARRTRAALQLAAGYAQDLDARLTLVVPQVVPFPLPLERPPVSANFTLSMLTTLASGQDLETTVHVYLCRDRNEGALQALARESTVVMGKPAHWWNSQDRSLVRSLRRAGHHLILADPRQSPHAFRALPGVASHR